MGCIWTALGNRLETAWKRPTKPNSKRPKDGEIIDEEKSVRWNREEVVRRQKAWDAECSRLKKAQNAEIEHISEAIELQIQEDIKAKTKRSKETKVNPKTGRAHTKKRFGKSLSRCAPAMFISILNKKANRYGGSVIKVSTFETKASQFDHTDESYTKKRLSERMAHLSSGEVVQRDLYSAFLLEYIDTESLEYNTKALNSAFPAFLVMHENTIKRLQKDKSYLPASVGF